MLSLQPLFAIMVVTVLVASVGYGQAARPAEGLRVDHRCIDEKDAVIPQASLDAARELRAVLGHESVGFNVVEGLKLLSDQNPQRYRLTVGHDARGPFFQRGSGLAEFFVQNMTNVPGKAAAFEQRLAGGLGAPADVISMKLCWADLQQRSDADAAFKDYIAIMEKMGKTYPQAKLVYWTMPLRKETMLNEKRARFNELVHDYAKQHPIVLFDIADIESHKPDGTLVTDPNGRPIMWEGYTYDGGHLNDTGRTRVARAWWWLTARLAGWAGQ